MWTVERRETEDYCHHSVILRNVSNILEDFRGFIQEAWNFIICPRIKSQYTLDTYKHPGTWLVSADLLGSGAAVRYNID